MHPDVGYVKEETLDCGGRDENGYPDESSLRVIREYPLEKVIRQPRELMLFIRGLWEFGDWGWKEIEKDGKVQYHISTGGWSGNEDLIGALKENCAFWGLYWEESRRGGHFKFEIRDFKEE